MWKWIKNLFKCKKKALEVKPQVPADQDSLTAYEIAQLEMQAGVKEIRGRKHNPRIVMYHQATSLKASDDETAWCAAFVNWCLNQVGLKGTNKANARSFLKYATATNDPKEGDIVVFWRGSKDSWKGHVGFFVKKDEKYVYCLGGNQSNEVNITRYPLSKVLDYRTLKTN